METKRIVTILSLSAALAVCGGASASKPTSQFGFSGWPYRQSTPCYGATQSACPTECPDATEAPRPTAEPTLAPILTPAPTPTPIPTAIPTAEPTAVPTAEPTAAPTEKPAAQPTAKPTKAPTATVSPSAAPSAPSTSGDYTTGSISTQEENAYRLLNADRQANGRAALALDAELCRLARIKSEDMNANRYFAHTSPTLGSAADLLRKYGYAFTSVGENIAHHATVDKAQAAFMSSAGHRTNILGSQWKKVGVGVCFDSNGYIYETQLFVR